MKKFIQILESIGGLLVAILFCVVLFQVVARVILRVPTSWSVEFGRVLFVAIVFLGSVILIYTKGHMVITTFVDILPPISKKIIDLFNSVLIISMFGAFSFGALEKTISGWGVVIPTLEWMTNGYMYLTVLIGGLGMLAFSIADLVKKLRRTA